MTTATMDSKVAERIRDLLRMAEHENSNINEAAIALEKAQELLLRHNLTRAEVMVDNEPQAPEGIGKVEGHESSLYRWKVTLLGIIARSNLCDVVLATYENRYHVFGTRTNVESVLTMYNWVIPQLIEMSLRDFKVYKQNGGRETGRRYYSGWQIGCVQAFRDRLKKPYEAFKYGTGKDLVIYNDKAIQEAVSKEFPRLRKTSFRRSVSDGTGAGYRAGKNVSLAPTKKIGGKLLLK